jgi:hypothetical protein
VFNQTQKNPTLKIPPSKAWRRLQPARAQRIALHPVHRSPRAQRIASHPAQRIASQTIRAPITSPPRIARRALRTPRTCSSAHTLRSTLRSFIWFVVLTFPKFNLYTSRIAFLLCVRSSVGYQPRNLPRVSGSSPGENFRIFSIFVIFFIHKKKKR